MARACRRAVATRLASFWREVGDGGGSVGWAAGGAGPGKWAPGKWLGFSLFLYICSVFYLIATEFKFKQI